MSKLEPRFEKKDTILFNELEDINEVLFIMDGEFEIGFEINSQKFYMFKCKNKVIEPKEGQRQIKGIH